MSFVYVAVEIHYLLGNEFARNVSHRYCLRITYKIMIKKWTEGAECAFL